MRPFDPATESYVNLATFRRDGREVRTPVWIAADAGCCYAFSEGQAGKVKRIRNNGRARMAACNYRGVVSSEWLEGRARVVENRELVERAYRALHRKYGWQMKAADFFSRLSGRYAKRAILEIRLEAASSES